MCNSRLRNLGYYFILNKKIKNQQNKQPHWKNRKNDSVHTDSLCVLVFMIPSLKRPFYYTSHCMGRTVSCGSLTGLKY